MRKVVLREHDLCDSFEVFRLVFAHPEELRGGEAREGNVGRQRGQLVFADAVSDFFAALADLPASVFAVSAAVFASILSFSRNMLVLLSSIF